MTARTWVRRLFARPPRTSRQEPARFRHILESLEGRCAPAILTANSTENNITGTSAALRLALTDTNEASDANEGFIDGGGI
jgi:hypothetical protein